MGGFRNCNSIRENAMKLLSCWDSMDPMEFSVKGVVEFS